MPRTKGQRCACGQSFGTEFRLAVHRRSHGARCHRCRTSFPDASLFREHSLLCRVSAANGPADASQSDLAPQTDASSLPAQPPKAETSPKTPEPIDTPRAETSSHADASFEIAEEEEPPELEEEEVSTVTIFQALPHQGSPPPDGADKSHADTESSQTSQGQEREPPEVEASEASEDGEQGATADFEKASGSTSAAEPSKVSVPQEAHSALSCKDCSQLFANRSELRHHRKAKVCSRKSEELVASEASASGAMEAASPEEPAESDEPEALSAKAEEAGLSEAELPRGKAKVSCKECGFSTPYPAQLRRHLMSAVGCRNQKILSSVTEDDGIVQRPDGDYECKECGYSCRQPAAMRRHKDGKAACRIRQNRSLVLASPHVRLEEVPPETGEEATGKQRLVCTRCCFAVAESLPFDMKAHLERPQACLMRRRRRAFQRLVSEGRLATAKGGGASCTACEQSFPSEPRALRHLQSARACRLALAAKATSPDCPSCDFVGGDVEELRSHLRAGRCQALDEDAPEEKKAKALLDGELPFACDKCSYSSTSFDQLRSHVASEQGCLIQQKRDGLVELQASGVVSRTSDGGWRCGRCGLESEDNFKVLRHLTSKDSEACRRTLISRRLQSLGTVCPACGEDKGDSAKLRAHLQTKKCSWSAKAKEEEDVKPVVELLRYVDEDLECENCPFTTRTRTSLGRHLGSKENCRREKRRAHLERLVTEGRLRKTDDGGFACTKCPHEVASYQAVSMFTHIQGAACGQEQRRVELARLISDGRVGKTQYGDFRCAKCRFVVLKHRGYAMMNHIEGQGCGIEQRRLELVQLAEAGRVLKTEDGGYRCGKCSFATDHSRAVAMLNHVQGKGCSLAQAAAVLKSLGAKETKCPECHKDLGSTQRLHYHVRRCLAGPDALDESSASIPAVKVEKGAEDADGFFSRESFACESCPFKTHIKACLMSHMKSRDGCSLTIKRDSLQKMCDAGRMERTLEGYRCAKCGYQVPSVRGHELVGHIEGLGCGLEQKRLELAKLVQAGRLTKGADGTYRCSNCPHLSDKGYAMLSHVQGVGCTRAQTAAILMSLGADDTACPRCQTDKGSPEMLQAHLRLCLAESGSFEKSKHVQSLKPDDSITAKLEPGVSETTWNDRFVCESCPFETRSKSCLMGHVSAKDACSRELKRKEVLKLCEAGRAEKTEEGGIRCLKCSFSVSSVRAYDIVSHLVGKGCGMEQRRQELAKLVAAGRVSKAEDGSFRCANCALVFEKNRAHAMLGHVKGVGCTRAHAAALMKTLADGVSVCPRCETDKGSLKKLKIHLGRCLADQAQPDSSATPLASLEAFACESCSFRTRSRTTLTMHMSIPDNCVREQKRDEIRQLCDEGRLEKMTNGGIRCLRCSFEVRAEISQMAMLKHVRGQGCHIAQIQVRLRALVAQGRVEETADEGLRCAECGFHVERSNRPRLLKHLDGPKACVRHKAAARFEGIDSPDCPVCGFASKNMNAMKGHVRYKHPDYLSTPSTTSEADVDAKDKADNETAAQAEESIAAPAQAPHLVKQEPEEVANESAPAPEDCAPPEQGPGSTPAAEPEQLSAPEPFELNEDEGGEVVPEELIPDEVTETAETEANQDEDEDETVPEEEEEEEPPSLDCRDCGLRTETEDDLAVHLEDAAECRSIALAAYLAKLFQGAPEGQCAHCDFASADGEELLAHAHRPDACRLEPAIRAMAKEELAECVCCGREMRGLAAVRAHLDTVDDCRQATLLTLQTTAASALEPCEECGTVFGSGGRLAAHYAAPFGCRLARETPPEAQLAADDEEDL